MNEPSEVFFIDEGLGGPTIAKALRDVGEKVVLHADHFHKGVEDVEWLEFAAQQRWLILTKDDGISRNPLEKAMVRRMGACVFALESQSMNGSDMAAAFTTARHRMKQFAKKHRGPFIAKVYRNGKVKAWKRADDL
ncbi:MAG: hypothetical protein LKM36_01170 [Flavobacteriales bacterium]|nr:hypothetical protein [Flavobacteriales bacterium]